MTDEWLAVMDSAHRHGMRTSATMMYGIGETNAERIESLLRLREQQARSKGFTAFISWPLQPENSEMADTPRLDAVSYLRTLAIARLALDNFDNLQASWVTMGMKIGQIALRFGANDFGSLMMEENVVSAANTTFSTTVEEMESLIRGAGFTPVRRRQDYSHIREAA
jgi:cyclic dehypoxanthinyl futalosine synthase